MRLATEIHVTTDIEADGSTPGPSSMLGFGSAADWVDQPLVSPFEATLQPLSGASRGRPPT